MQLFDLLKNCKINYSFPLEKEAKSINYKLWTKYFPNEEDDLQFGKLIRSSKRYTKNYLRLTPDEIEILFGMSYDDFIYYNTKNQICLKCNDRNTERENLDYYLSIDQLVVITKGYCKSCGNALDGGRGIQSLKKLYEVLNK